MMRGRRKKEKPYLRLHEKAGKKFLICLTSCVFGSFKTIAIFFLNIVTK